MSDYKQENHDEKILMSAKDLQAAGFTRATTYNLLNRSDLPVVCFGRRRFMIRDKFMAWLEQQAVNQEIGESV